MLSCYTIFSNIKAVREITADIVIFTKRSNNRVKIISRGNVRRTCQKITLGMISFPIVTVNTFKWLHPFTIFHSAVQWPNILSTGIWVIILLWRSAQLVIFAETDSGIFPEFKSGHECIDKVLKGRRYFWASEHTLCTNHCDSVTSTFKHVAKKEKNLLALPNPMCNMLYLFSWCRVAGLQGIERYTYLRTFR